MKEHTLQVCFILDCTASMGPWIEAAKERIVETMKTVQRNYPTYTMYAAFIGYRDFHDHDQFIKYDFTYNIQRLQEDIIDIEADGGDDTCEDVAGAYHLVNTLDWNADVKCIFHITDAPNHGIIYHDKIVDDDYPNGHPYIDLKSEVKEIASKQIDLTLFSIKPTTNIMYRIIRSCYEVIRRDGFSIVNLLNSRYYNPSEVFYTEVSQRLSNSINSSL